MNMKPSVFVIENNPMYSLFLTMKLDDLFNYTTHFFPSAEEALANMHLKPGILILDYMLDGMNGMDATKKIKQAYPAIQIIVLSAQQEPQVAANLVSAGAYCYIQKDKDAPQKIVDAILEITQGK
jgi:CheY-like chemotaxis protein